MRTYILFTLYFCFLALRHLTASSGGLIADAPLHGSLLPPILRFAPEILSMTLLLFCMRSGFRGLGSFWNLLFLAFMSYIVINGISGIAFSATVEISSLISALRVHLNWMIPFLLGFFILRQADRYPMAKVILVIGFLQIPLAILQYNHVDNADFVTGLMGEYGSGVLGIFQTIGSMFLLSAWLHSKGDRMLLLSAILFLLPIPFASALGPMLAAPLFLFLVIMLAMRSKGRVLRIMIGLAASAGTVALVGIMFNSIGNFNFDSMPILYQHLISRYFSDSDGINRVTFFLFVIRFLSDSPMRFLFGCGTGFAASSRIHEQHVIENILPGSTGAGSMATNILIENGFLGLVFMMIFIAGIFVCAIRLRCAAKGRGELVYLDWFLVSLISLIVYSFYNASFTAPALAWIMMPHCGIVVRWARDVSVRSHAKIRRNIRSMATG
jgi:hypothetical protein